MIYNITQNYNIVNNVFNMLYLKMSCVYCYRSHVCIVVILRVFVVLCMCIAVFTFDARLLARSRYSEGPATGHLDTGFS